MYLPENYNVRKIFLKEVHAPSHYTYEGATVKVPINLPKMGQGVSMGTLGKIQKDRLEARNRARRNLAQAIAEVKKNTLAAYKQALVMLQGAIGDAERAKGDGLAEKKQAEDLTKQYIKEMETKFPQVKTEKLRTVCQHCFPGVPTCYDELMKTVPLPKTLKRLTLTIPGQETMQVPVDAVTAYNEEILNPEFPVIEGGLITIAIWKCARYPEAGELLPYEMEAIAKWADVMIQTNQFTESFQVLYNHLKNVPVTRGQLFTVALWKLSMKHALSTDELREYNHQKDLKEGKKKRDKWLKIGIIIAACAAAILTAGALIPGVFAAIGSAIAGAAGAVYAAGAWVVSGIASVVTYGVKMAGELATKGWEALKGQITPEKAADAAKKALKKKAEEAAKEAALMAQEIPAAEREPVSTEMEPMLETKPAFAFNPLMLIPILAIGGLILFGKSTFLSTMSASMLGNWMTHGGIIPIVGE